MIAWWALEVAANTTISLAYFTICVLILVPLIRLRQLKTKKLGAATAAIFLSCAVGHGMNALGPFLQMSGMQRSGAAIPHLGHWWMACWHTVTAVIAVYYVTLRSYYGQLLVKAPTFDDLAERQRIGELEAFKVEAAARTKAESERDAYASMLDSVVKNSQAAITVKDLEGRYLLANPSMLQIMDLTEEEILGRTDMIWGAELAPSWRAADLLAREGPHRVVECCDNLGDGRHFYDATKFPLTDAAGEVYATCGISIDVTTERRVTAELTEARDEALAATAAKSTFLATMSHEIRTPMNAVIGMTDLLLDTSLDEQQHEFVDTVRISGDALLAVINDVLDFSKIESGELRIESAPFQLAENVESCLDLLRESARAKGLVLVSYLDESCPDVVVGDAPRLRQILINLLSNAVKFTAKGEVLVSVSAQPIEHDRLELRLSVLDTGIGIPREALPSLFKSFSQVDASTTRKYGGTGLGLAISLRLAQAMHGDVQVDSEPGRGSEFTVRVVLGTPEPVEDTSGAPTAAPSSLVGLTALLVDDHATNLRILDLQLTRLGMQCTSVHGSEAALALVRDGLSYDVAILDMFMPTMNGVELAAALREVPGTAGAPIILLSSEGSRPYSAGSNFAGFLAKPVKTGALRSVLATVLDSPKATAGAPIRSAIGVAPLPLRVLLAEDNPVNQRVAELMLRKLGHTVDMVGTGVAAVKAALASSYDVVLMDVQMPEMDGLEATRPLRESSLAHPQPYIIAMTANVTVEDERACLAAGMDSFLTKPVRAGELQRALERVPALTRVAT